MSGFVAVHVGAGYHAEQKRALYKDLCKKSCQEAVKHVQAGSSAVEAVATAVSILEDSELTNAGVGSYLTINGVVECDAAIMDGTSLEFGSVGALYGINNPIKVAQAILLERTRGLLPHGRIPPCTLVGKGALEWARCRGFPVVDSSTMVTKLNRAAHSKISSVLVSGSVNAEPSRPSSIYEDLLDTVGAIAIDSSGNIASAVSSGGLMMKYSGRIGQAAVYGAGCWAQGGVSDSNIGVGVSISGMGEYIVKTLLAKECFDSLAAGQEFPVSVLPSVFRTKFVESPYLKNVHCKHAGALAIMHYPEEKMAEVMWTHTTRTFLLGYMSANSNRAHFVASERKALESQSDMAIVSSGKRISLSN